MNVGITLYKLSYKYKKKCISEYIFVIYNKLHFLFIVAAPPLHHWAWQQHPCMQLVLDLAQYDTSWAICSGVSPRSFTLLGSAPALRSNRTMSLWPLKAAVCNGVNPNCDVVLCFALLSRRSCITWVNPVKGIKVILQGYFTNKYFIIWGSYESPASPLSFHIWWALIGYVLQAPWRSFLCPIFLARTWKWQNVLLVSYYCPSVLSYTVGALISL